ncbi:MAG: DUF2851 family protein [Saprospiraceae bacterium]|nr:DUF2851 family protein [Saprospiraceae bacterium]
MREDFLHFLWRTRRFDLSNLTTTDGQTLEILDFGDYNALDAGADFQNVKIKIGDIIWCGTVEMHVKSSDWWQHGHQKNAAYNNVILHVVYEEDEPIEQNTEGGHLPCLVLKNRIPEGIFQKYWSILHNEHWIPCQHHFYTVSEITKDMWLERLLVERLERKTEAIAVAFERNKGDWEETFWQFIARYFGSKVNSDPMEMMAQRVPHLVLAKHKNQLFQIEALLFGQAGLLADNFVDEYPQKLQKEYQFLQKKHSLSAPLSKTTWKFSRMRPQSFPTIRLAQLAALIHRSSHLFSKVIDNMSIIDLKKLFEIETSDYWHTHFVFDTPSVKSSKSVHKLGSETIDLLLINVVAPFLFFYGTSRKDDIMKERALILLDNLKAEKNVVMDGWKSLGLDTKSAARSQALIQLKTTYCETKNCVNCAVGVAILKNMT